jgi:hypothetical protein
MMFLRQNPKILMKIMPSENEDSDYTSLDRE